MIKILMLLGLMISSVSAQGVTDFSVANPPIFELNSPNTSVMNNIMINPYPTSLIIHGGKGTMVTINLKDGSVTFGEGYDLDEVAKSFWYAMGKRMCVN